MLLHFSGVVAVGSKGGLTVPDAMHAVAVSTWAVALSMWAIADSMWAVTSSMSEVMAYVHGAHVTCGMSHPLYELSQPPHGLL